jgi:hypothetical protein
MEIKMNFLGHSVVWEKVFLEGGIPSRFTDADFFQWFIQGNQSTDDFPAWQDFLFGLYEWTLGLPATLLEGRTFDFSFADELTCYYGASPVATNNGALQCLHANRVWVGRGDEARCGLGRVESAYTSCSMLKRRIADATIRALKFWSQDRYRAVHWIGHAAHMIEDSFATGHTRRDDRTGALLDHCTSCRPYHHYDESLHRSIQICAHMDPGADAIQEWNAAVRADREYLRLVDEMITLVEQDEEWETILEQRLEDYFDHSPGYFKQTHLSRAVPIYFSKCDGKSFAGDWDLYVPFHEGEHYYVFAYKRQTGTCAFMGMDSYGASDMRLSRTMSDAGIIEAGFTHLFPVEGPDGRAWLVGYQPEGGWGNLYQVSLAHGLSCLQRIQWPADMTDLVSTHADACNWYVFGYRRYNPHARTGGNLFVARLNLQKPDDLDFSIVNVFEPQNLIYSGVIPEDVAAGMQLLSQVSDASEDTVTSIECTQDLLFYHPGGHTLLFRIYFENSLERIILDDPQKIQLPPNMEAFVPFEARRDFTGEPQLYTYFLARFLDDDPRLWQLFRLTRSAEQPSPIVRKGHFSPRGGATVHPPFEVGGCQYLLLSFHASRTPLQLFRLLSEVPNVEICMVNHNTPGSDLRTNEKLNEEWVELTTNRKSPVNLTGWTLSDQSNHRYTFNSFILMPGQVVRIHTGKGADTASDLYCGRAWYIWNNQGDIATLKELDGAVVDVYKYGSL